MQERKPINAVDNELRKREYNMRRTSAQATAENCSAHFAVYQDKSTLTLILRYYFLIAVNNQS